jgi:hypothetical protein
MITAAVTFVLAIPANSDYWRMEIWKRGGGAWTFDKNGHLSWTWLVKPILDTPSEKRVTVPSSQKNIRRRLPHPPETKRPAGVFQAGRFESN